MKSSVKSRLSHIGFACVLSLIAAEAPMASGAPTVNVVVMTGDPAPDGNGIFSTFDFNPALNDAGQVAFVARLANTNGGFSDDSGIFRGDGMTVAQIARESQAAPDGNGNLGPFASNFYGTPINESGQVSFAANLSDTAGASADDGGVFLGDGTTLIQLVREGQPWPDGAGFFGTPKGALNNAGQVSFWSASSSIGGRERIFRTDGTLLVEIARDGRDAPDGIGRFRQFSFETAINDAGQVAFGGGLTGTSGGDTGSNSDDSGIFRSDGTTLTQIARENEAAPDGNGRYAGFTGYTTLNALGQVAFKADFRDTVSGFSDDGGISRGDGTSLVEIAREGQIAPDGNGRFREFAGVAPAALNDLGQVAFVASLTGATGGNSGIFRGDGATLVQVVREGQAAPDGNGRFSFIGDDPALNDTGQLAFRIGLTGTSGGASDNTGIYFFDDAVGLLQVVRKNDAFLGSTITELGFASPARLGDEGSGLSDRGVPRVAYFFRLADSREGIAIWTLVPEPASLALLLAGLLAMFFHRPAATQSIVVLSELPCSNRFLISRGGITP